MRKLSSPAAAHGPAPPDPGDSRAGAGGSHLVGVAVAAVLTYYAYDLPDIGQVAQAERRPTVTVLAADGSRIERYGDIYGTTINAADLPPHLIHAVMATEDRRFFSHFGIDPIGLMRPSSSTSRPAGWCRAARRSPSSLPRTCS